jgi:carbon monoxide dehydrogenase subunit G
VSDADRSAPVYETGQIDIGATPEVVYDTLTDVDSWPQWLPGVKSMTTHGPFAPGTTFEWKAGPGRIKSEVVTANRPDTATWKGRTLGIDAVHTWRMTPSATGTHVETAESFAGLLPKLLPKVMRKPVRQALDEGLPALKTEAERRAAQT